MRTARLVGPTADGTSVVLVTDDGEEIEVLVAPDDPLTRALHPEPDDATATATTTATTTAPTTDGAATAGAPTDQATTVAGDAPDAPTPDPVRRPTRRRETPPVDTTLSPRDIQTRIRGGESLEDLVASSGLDADRVERFAAPVLAEREHMALTALGASVRRRGEASGHRPLRTVVAERLLGQGVDADDVVWDAWKRDDNQWQVSADYELLDQERHAEFRYDPQGRFSVAEDDDARWLAGERPSPVAAVVDRDDELALVRATSEPGRDESDQEVTEQLDVGDDLVAVLQVVPPVELSAEELAELVADDPESDERDLAPDLGPPATRAAQLPGHGGSGDDGSGDDGSGEETRDARARRRDEAAEPTIAVVRHLTTVSVEVDAEIDLDAEGEDARSALDTLYDMLGGADHAEESTRVYAGLTDASAVPVVDEHEFEPPAAVQVPAEPGPESPEPDDAPAEPDGGPAGPDDVVERDERTEPTRVVEREQLRTPEVEVQHDAAEAPPVPDVDEPLIPAPGASRKPGRRKRASVPSWDEIMFGGPKPG